MADVLALIDDLFFQSKVAETARQVGVEVRMVTSGPALIAAAQAESPRLVLVDLNARQAPIEAVEQLKTAAKGAASPLPIIGFLSHVQTELAERARTAGCQQVMPRSKFTADLATILGRARA